ncbi:MAG: hypothetical protein IJI14_20620 [Anaerolineaceae bacterium]|nr:hypothetical protein [Anaerolineaceae bacterium]
MQQKELPGLRGFSARNIRNMRIFYEEWALSLSVSENNIQSANLAVVIAKFTNDEFWQLQLPNYDKEFYSAFVAVGFTQHTFIITKIKSIEERIFYIKLCASEHLTVDHLKIRIASDEYHHQAQLPNNFLQIEKRSFQNSLSWPAFRLFEHPRWI